MHTHHSILFLDDLLREELWEARAFFYDVLIPTITLGVKGSSFYSPHPEQPNNALPNFSVSRFRSLAKAEGEKWFHLYRRPLREEARDYLIGQIQLIPRAFVVSYEMPPWLRALLDEEAIPYVELRIAPIRFGHDLYLAARSNQTQLNRMLWNHSVESGQLYLEAAEIQASVKHTYRAAGLQMQTSDGPIYVGQTGDDASLVKQEGGYARITDYLPELLSCAPNKKIYYKPHPYAGDFAHWEVSFLEKHFAVEIVSDNIYTILSMPTGTRLVGLSSGVLQEAKYFNKDTKTLFSHVCNIAEHVEQLELGDYALLAPEIALSPCLWTGLVHRAPETPVKPRKWQPNHLRTLHDVWWDYDNYLKKYHRLYRHPALVGESLRSEVSALCKRLELELEKEKEEQRKARHSVDALEAQVLELQRELRDARHRVEQLEKFFHSARAGRLYKMLEAFGIFPRSK